MLRKYRSLKIAVYCIFGFMLAPLVIIVGASVNASGMLAFPPQGLSLQWYAAILDDPRWVESTVTSVLLAVATTLVCVALAFTASVSITWWRWRGSSAYAFLLILPLIVPFTATGVALVLIFRQWGLLGSFTGFLLAHVVVTIPFAFRAVLMSIEEFDRNYYDAGMMLGANPLKSFFRIVIPLIAPGIAAGAVFSFLLSFDEATISLLLVGPSISTLPVEMYGQASESASPVVAAVATLQILVVLLLIWLTKRVFGLRVFTDSH